MAAVWASGWPACVQAARSHSTRNESKPRANNGSSRQVGARSPPRLQILQDAPSGVDGGKAMPGGVEGLGEIQAGDDVARQAGQRSPEVVGGHRGGRRSGAPALGLPPEGGTEGVVQRRRLRLGLRGRLQVGHEGGVLEAAGSQRLPAARDQVGDFIRSGRTRRFSLRPQEFGGHCAQFLPELRERTVPGPHPRRLGQETTLVLVLQVVVEELFQIVGAVIDALPTIAEEGRQLAVVGLLKDQGAGRGRLEGAAAALVTCAIVENDPRPSQQAPVALPARARANDDAPATPQPRQAGQPRHTFALHRRVEVADKEDVDVARGIRPVLFEEGTLGAAQVAGTDPGLTFGIQELRPPACR